MVSIIGVRFKKVGKVYHFDPAGLEVKQGEFVIVETSSLATALLVSIEDAANKCA